MSSMVPDHRAWPIRKGSGSREPDKLRICVNLFDLILYCTSHLICRDGSFLGLTSSKLGLSGRRKIYTMIGVY